MAAISGLWAREVLDSRGIPAIECTAWLDNGGVVATSVPSGTSIGQYEALELRDNDPQRYDGLGVLKAVEIINTQIAPRLVGQDPTEQAKIDQFLIELDGTENKKNLGANTTLAVSQAVLKAGAFSMGKPLYFYLKQLYQLTDYLSIPTGVYTLVSGGEHGAENLDIQEFQVIPASFIEFDKSLEMATNLFHQLERVLITKKVTHSVGILGGFTPTLYSNTDVFELLTETIKTSRYVLAQDLFFGIDASAQSFFTGNKYLLRDKGGGYKADELLKYYKQIRDLYRVFYIEDPFREKDQKHWAALMEDLGSRVRIISDSLTATNLKRTQEATEKKLANTLVIKPNQVGTISETVEVIKLARSANWQIVVSHRSGETNDDFIADFAVGVGADYMKFGPPNRGERVSKYNRLLMIFHELKQAQNSSQTTQTQSTSTANNS